MGFQTQRLWKKKSVKMCVLKVGKFPIILKHTVFFRVHPDGEEAIADFSCCGYARGSNIGSEYRHVFFAVQNALQWLAQTGGAGAGIRELVFLGKIQNTFITLLVMYLLLRSRWVLS